MKSYLFVFLATIVLTLSACDKTPDDPSDEVPQHGTVDQGDIRLFPMSEYGYVGDPMPFNDNGTMRMYYLLDERGGTIGFHPYALLNTTDFLHWEDIGTVIPYVNSISSPDLAIGTGSVIRDADGLYHAFYTGWNGRGDLPYTEKIQHATSDDGVNWTKHPDAGFYGGQNDFRDPYIYYDEPSGEYWMLITTRDYSGGVIRRYTSTDLWNWQNDGVFYRNTDGTYNMECPTLIEYNGYYYLTFSVQGTGNERVVKYRYTDDLSKGFTTPEDDSFDGWGFYAGRLEYWQDRLILSGWVPTKTLAIDKGTYMWGGNLVTHQIVQDETGLLSVTILDEIDQALSTEVRYDVASTNVATTSDAFVFEGDAPYEYVLFDALDAKATKWTATVDVSDSVNFGITLNAYESIIGDLNVFFDLANHRIEFYTEPANRIEDSTAEIIIPHDFSDTDELHLTILTEGDVILVYVNDDVVLTSRAYNMAESEFGFFTLSSSATLRNVRFYE
jgi:beta-fructofuranosidase